MNPAGPVDPEQMRRRLRALFNQDSEHSLSAQITRGMIDPASPVTHGGRPRPHPLWLAVGLSAAVAIVVFTLFSFLER